MALKYQGLKRDDVDHGREKGYLLVEMGGFASIYEEFAAMVAWRSRIFCLEKINP